MGPFPRAQGLKDRGKGNIEWIMPLRASCGAYLSTSNIGERRIPDNLNDALYQRSGSMENPGGGRRGQAGSPVQWTPACGGELGQHGGSVSLPDALCTCRGEEHREPNVTPWTERGLGKEAL